MGDSQNPTINKRRHREAAVDRITSLPDSVRLHIMSLLPAKDVVKTGALSKEWQFLCTSVPNLVFRRISQSNFAEAVDKTLMLHSSPKITKFSISLRFEDALKHRVDDWVRFAVSRQVEVLELRFRISMPKYPLPCFLYNNNPTLTKLTIENCLLHLPAGVHFPSLKTFILIKATLSDGAIGKLLSACPLLESLTLCLCSGVENLKLSSTSLKRFSSGNYGNSVTEVCAPNLRSLIIVADWCFTDYKLIDASSLVDVDLYVLDICLPRLRESGPHNRELRKLKELLQQLKKAEKLTFHLRGTVGLQETSINDIVLEGKAFWRSQEKELFTFLKLTLERVEIIGFAPNKVGWEFVDPLVEFFLENALVLKEVVIDMKAKGVYNPGNLAGLEEESKISEATQQILGYKRASSAAEVLFRS